MPDEMMPDSVAATVNDNEDFQLTGRERRIISNFRALRPAAQDMLFHLSEQYRCTLPAIQPLPN